MKVNVTTETAQDGVTRVSLEQSRSGLQIAVTCSKDGFVIQPGELFKLVPYSGLAFEIIPHPQGAQIARAHEDSNWFNTAIEQEAK